MLCNGQRKKSKRKLSLVSDCSHIVEILYFSAGVFYEFTLIQNIFGFPIFKMKKR